MTGRTRSGTGIGALLCFVFSRPLFGHEEFRHPPRRSEGAFPGLRRGILGERRVAWSRTKRSETPSFAATSRASSSRSSARSGVEMLLFNSGEIVVNGMMLRAVVVPMVHLEESVDLLVHRARSPHDQRGDPKLPQDSSDPASLSLAAAPVEERAQQIAGEIIAALTIRAASLRIDDVTAPPYAREVKVTTEPMRLRFAMRFGMTATMRKCCQCSRARPHGRERRACGRHSILHRQPSARRPWISTTAVIRRRTGICRRTPSIWNIGKAASIATKAMRFARIAAGFAAEVLAGPLRDVWESVFDFARDRRSPGKNDLVPYRILGGDAKIERHVPALPFSREVERLNGLRRALAICRIVFGHSRQEDLIAYLLAQIPEDERDAIVAELQIDQPDEPQRMRNLTRYRRDEERQRDMYPLMY